jgi:hypothetical protein
MLDSCINDDIITPSTKHFADTLKQNGDTKWIL